MSEAPFGPDSPVLDFGPTHEPMRYARSSQEWFVWPVWVVPVLCHIQSMRRLNILQEHVLALCAQGLGRPEDIRATLQLPEELIPLILRELEESRLIDRRHKATNEGMSYLAGDDTYTETVRAVLFADAVNGAPLPFLYAAELPTCEAPPRSSGSRELITGTAGRPITRKVFEVSPGRQGPPRYEEQQLLEANHQAWRLHQYNKKRREPLAPEETLAARLERGELVGRATLVQAVEGVRPTSAFVLSYSFVPEHGVTWHVCDPFGHGPSLPWRRRVSSHEKLSKRCDRRVHAELVGGADDHAMNLQPEAARVLREALPRSFRWPDEELEQSFTAALGQLERIERHEKLGSAQLTPVLTATIACLEYALLAYTQRWLGQTGRTPNHLYGRLPARSSASGTLGIMARSLGFEHDDDNPRNIFEGTQRDRTIGAIKYDNLKLRDNLAGAVLVSVDFPDSPLAQLAIAWPDLLAQLQRLSRWRNDFSHASRGMAEWAGGDAALVRTLLIDVARVLFAESSAERVRVTRERSEHEQRVINEAHDHQRRIERRARIAARERFLGFDGVADRARIEDLYKALRINLSALPDEAPLESAHAASVLMQCARLCEQIIEWLSRYSKGKPSLRDVSATDSDANNQHLVDILRGLDIDIPADTRQLEVFGRTNPRRLRNALGYDDPRGTGPRFWRIALLAHHDTTPGHALGTRHSSWADDMSWLMSERGHGERTHVPVQLAKEAARRIERLLEHTLHVLYSPTEP